MEENKIYLNDLKTSYKALFMCIDELYNLFYDVRPGKNIEEIKKALKKLYEDGHLNDSLCINLDSLIVFYDELTPVKVAKAYKVDEFKEQNKLQNINKLLNITIKELNDEIRDVAQEISERRLSDQED